MPECFLFSGWQSDACIKSMYALLLSESCLCWKCAYTLPLSKSGVANLHMICPQEDPLIVVSLRIFLPTLLLNKEKELVPVICPMALGFSQEALLLWISSILGFLFWVFWKHYVCVSVCVCACMCARMRVCACMCVHACVRVYVCVCVFCGIFWGGEGEGLLFVSFV